MKRLPWVEQKFQTDLPSGWLPNILSRLQGTTIRLRYYATIINDQADSTRTNDKWSIKEHIGHLADLEDLHIGRIKDFQSQKKVLRPADMSNKATEEANHNVFPILELINKFDTKRKEFLHLLSILPDEILEFRSEHPRLKTIMKPVDIAYFAAEHDDHHIASILEIIKTESKNP